MFVSDTIHNAQYIHSLFFPMMMDLISLNTTLLLDHNWFDDLTTHSDIHTHLTASCICPQFSPWHTVSRSYSTKTRWVFCIRFTFKFCNRKRKFFISIWGLLDPVLQQYSHSSEGENKPSVRTSGFALCPLKQPAIHAVPTDLWAAEHRIHTSR